MHPTALPLEPVVLVSGPCSLAAGGGGGSSSSNNCMRSPNFPSNYGVHSQSCTVGQIDFFFQFFLILGMQNKLTHITTCVSYFSIF
jgi:hypothetical protein